MLCFFLHYFQLVFTRFDKDKSNTISSFEMRNALTETGWAAGIFFNFSFDNINILLGRTQDISLYLRFSTQQSAV